MGIWVVSSNFSINLKLFQRKKFILKNQLDAFMELVL